MNVLDIKPNWKVVGIVAAAAVSWGIVVTKVDANKVLSEATADKVETISSQMTAVSTKVDILLTQKEVTKK